MSEYWKSTPKYWCKFCKLYVRDTNFEKQQHEATPKHQSSIQRSLRDLHRNREREDRESQRAKDEVARLNRLVGGGNSASEGSKDAPKPKSSFAPAPPRKATAEERKAQIAKLAEMGVAVPEEYRREMAMVGDWETVSAKPVDPPTVKKEDPDGKGAVPLNVGVRKRKADENEEEEPSSIAPKKPWGARLKTYPGSTSTEENLDMLFSGDRVKKSEATDEDTGATEEPPKIKSEETDDNTAPQEKSNDSPLAAKETPPLDTEPSNPATGIVFKKRKGKAFRPK